MNEKISVIMTTYNQNASFLQSAIESVLQQTHSNFEFIIIDDGSTEKESVQMLEDFFRKDERIKLIKNSNNLGIIKSRNIGLREAQGKYVAVLDSDDLSDKKRLAEQLEFMELNKETALCGTWTYIINENGEVIGKKQSPTKSTDIFEKIISHNFFTHSSFFFKRKIIDEIGPYDENAVKCEDYEFLLRIISKYPVAIIPEYLTYYRINSIGDSLSGNKLSQKNSLKIRLIALKSGCFPKIFYPKLAMPLFVYLFVPTFLKQMLLRNIWQKTT